MNLQLPVSYEEVTTLFSHDMLVQKLMDFVLPLETEEEKVIRHIARGRTSGKIVFIHGEPGSGKSTFVESLGWRKHLGLRMILHVNCSLHFPPLGLTDTLRQLNDIAIRAAKEKDLGPTVAVLDYLENLEGYDEQSIRGFFRALNGVLRASPLIVLWPVVSLADAQKMITVSEGLSGTMFTKGEEIIHFSGPPLEKFVSITEATISVANEGKPLTDFGLTRGDLEEALLRLTKKTASERVLRKYLESVKDIWSEKSGYLKQAVDKIPKFAEVWFVICHTKAEDIVKTFARRGDRVEDAWLANHDALYEYVKDTQRASTWNARKLQLAINGFMTTRILYIPTNSLVAAIAAYGDNPTVRQLILSNGGSKNWTQKARAAKYFRSTPLYRQLAGTPPLVGKRKSGPGLAAIVKAEPAYVALNKWLASDPGHDSVFNNAVAALIKEVLGDSFDRVLVGKPHPWIPNVVPDIRCDPAGQKRHISIEFHFTNNKQPNEVADYCLRKMATYLQQIEHYLSINP